MLADGSLIQPILPINSSASRLKGAGVKMYLLSGDFLY